MNTTTLKVIVIDDDPKFHETYAYYFSTYLEYRLAGIYRSVEDALEDYELVKPDIILSEVNFRGLSGIDGLVEIRKKNAQAKVIMVSSNNEFEGIKKAFKYGAVGYLTKPISKKRLRHALNSIKYEGAAISNDIAKKVISMFRKKNYDCFSERENQIIEYLGQGATYKAIAEKLFVTTSTINFHIQNIYLKLDVNSKSEALKKIRELEYA
ncbi:response regulator transcription factor [Robiginitalea sp. IMCC43444]|uniref:response regulator transcription factor n=1 Tax=Robiginitalea sp. IMCC43444 TaxID=3459121 RepID=UPI0040428EED